MIKQQTKSKRILLLITIILSLVMNVIKVNAECLMCTDSSGSGSQGETNKDGTPIEYPGPGTAYDCGGGLTANCGGSYSISMSSQVYVDMYDFIKDTPINNVSSISQNLLAGTFVGLNVYEKLSYSISVRTWATGIQEYHKCRKEEYKTVGCYAAYSTSKCPPSLRIKAWVSQGTSEQKEPCPAGGGNVRYIDEGSVFKGAAACTEAYKVCQKSAASAASAAAPQLTPSYKVAYKDSNDIDKTSSNGKYDTAEIVEASTSQFPDEIIDDVVGNYYYLKKTATFYYNRGRACINVKTGKVRYTIDECETDEYTINPVVANDGNAYWKYFIPLNTNSAEGFSFTLNSSGNKRQASICKSIIDKYDNYADLIADSNRNSLPKVTSEMNEAQINAVKNRAKALVAKGCYYQTTIEIPIEQKFYNEVNSGQNFNGFNFYYKPIDINNPFPNGLNDTSLWYEWNESITKEPDLTQSYDEVTYVAKTSGNETSIRNYTQSNKYTNWDNMYINGKSGFIEKEGIVTRKNGVENSFYALGCGPNNSNLDVSNAFYQKECNE